MRLILASVRVYVCVYVCAHTHALAEVMTIQIKKLLLFNGIETKIPGKANASTLFRSKHVDLLLTHLVCVRRYRHRNWDNNVAHRGNLSSRMDKMHTGSTWIDDIAEKERKIQSLSSLSNRFTLTPHSREVLPNVSWPL